jgi:hypothetical protein
MTGWSIGRTAVVALVVAGASMPAAARVYPGVRAGISRSSLVQKIDLDYWSGSCLGYSVAALADIPFYERFSLRPEIALAYEGGSYHSGEEDGSFLVKHSLRNYSLQPSVNIAFNIPISGVKMSVYGGPALDLHLWDKTSTGKTESPSAPAAATVRPVDVAISTGISVEYKGVFFSINTLAGTLYRQTGRIEDQPPVFQNNLTFSLGYIFR